MFKELTKAIEQVRTEYAFKLKVSGKGIQGEKLIAEKLLKRELLKIGSDGSIKLSAARAFEVSPENLTLLKPGMKLILEGEVIRYGSRFGASEKFAIPKKVALDIK